MKTIQSAVLLGFLLSTSVFAQETNAPAKAPAAPPTVRERPGALPGPGALLGRSLDVLTPEQRSSWRTAMAEQRDKFREIQGKLIPARKDLFDAILSGKSDEAAIRQKAQAVASLQAELTVIQAKALSQVHPPLTAEQVEKLRGGEGGASEGRPNLESRARRQLAPPQSGTDENGLPPKQ
jgi:Spy/CpxP family protein refolding chaperone